METLGAATNRRLTWDEVAARADLIGGDLQVNDEDIGVSRGPVSAIEATGFVIIRCEWRAKLKQGGWVIRDAGPETAYFCFDPGLTSAVPRDAGGGRVSFNVRYNGPCMLYPQGYESNLSRDKVRDK